MKHYRPILMEALSMIYKDLNETKLYWRSQEKLIQPPECDCEKCGHEFGEMMRLGEIQQEKLDSAFSAITDVFTFYEHPLPEFDPEIGWVRDELDDESYALWKEQRK